VRSAVRAAACHRRAHPVRQEQRPAAGRGAAARVAPAPDRPGPDPCDPHRGRPRPRRDPRGPRLPTGLGVGPRARRERGRRGRRQRHHLHHARPPDPASGADRHGHRPPGARAGPGHRRSRGRDRPPGGAGRPGRHLLRGARPPLLLVVPGGRPHPGRGDRDLRGLWAAEEVERSRATSNRTTIPAFDAEHCLDTGGLLGLLVDPRLAASCATLEHEPVTVDGLCGHLRSHTGGDDGWTICMHVDGQEATTASVVAELAEGCAPGGARVDGLALPIGLRPRGRRPPPGRGPGLGALRGARRPRRRRRAGAAPCAGGGAGRHRGGRSGLERRGLGAGRGDPGG
jgi:hypothetical protein